MFSNFLLKALSRQKKALSFIKEVSAVIIPCVFIFLCFFKAQIVNFLFQSMKHGYCLNES